MGPPVITYVDLITASALLFTAAALSLALSLKLERGLIIGGVRTVVQLTLLGLALKWLFAVSDPRLVGLFLLIMLVIAAQTARSRVRSAPVGTYWRSLVALTVPGVAVTLLVTGGVMDTQPWYAPRYVLPIAGMVIGNSMSAVAVALDRLFSELAAQRERIDALLALGAQPSEAARQAVREGVRAGMIPTLNALGAAGLVFIPGMMSGQILSGADPILASRYQIVILLMVCAAAALGSVIAVVLGVRSAFDREERFVLGGGE